jgi:hypothetical protein
MDSVVVFLFFRFFYFSLFSPLLFFRIKISAYNPPFQKVHYNFLSQQLLFSQSCQTLATAEDTLLMVALLRNQDLVLFQGDSFGRDILRPLPVPSEAQSQLII